MYFSRIGYRLTAGRESGQTQQKEMSMFLLLTAQNESNMLEYNFPRCQTPTSGNLLYRRNIGRVGIFVVLQDYEYFKVN